MRHRERRGGPSAPLLALVFLLSSVGTAVAQDRYEELLEELPKVELGSECTAEQEGDLAAVPGTIVICAPMADDPDRLWWREASGNEVQAALEGTDEPIEAEADGSRRRPASTPGAGGWPRGRNSPRGSPSGSP